MADLELVRELAREETGLVVVSSLRADGTAQASVVNAGVLDHPVSGDPVIGLVTRAGSRKRHNLRERPRMTLTFRRGWRWVTVEGEAELIGPDDPVDGVDAERLRLLLREVFTAAGGTHDDWDAYDATMAQERRVAVLVTPGLVYTNPTAG